MHMGTQNPTKTVGMNQDIESLTLKRPAAHLFSVGMQGISERYVRIVLKGPLASSELSSFSKRYLSYFPMLWVEWNPTPAKIAESVMPSIVIPRLAA